MGLFDRLRARRAQQTPGPTPAQPDPNPNLMPFRPLEPDRAAETLPPALADEIPALRLDGLELVTPEPELHAITEQRALRHDAHIDSLPTMEIRLPSAATVHPTRPRPAEHAAAPEAFPRSPMQRLVAHRSRWIKPEGLSVTPAPVVNALVLDRHQVSCWLVKSILLGHRFGISIAHSIEDAAAKMATGLFDIAFVDVGDGAGPEVEFIQNVNVATPHLPVVAIAREDAQALAGCTTLARVVKPLRMARLNEAATAAARQVSRTQTEARRRATARLSVHLAGPAGAELDCVATSVSLSGLMLESTLPDAEPAAPFETFFAGLEREPVQVSVALDGKPVVHLTARRVFTEETPDHRIRQVGVSIRPGESELQALRGLISSVA